MDITNLNSSYQSSSSSTISTASESQSSNKFWKQYKRGRRSLSFWKLIKLILLTRNKREYCPSESSKLQTIEQFYDQLYHQDSSNTKYDNKVCINEDYGTVFVNSHQISMERNLSIIQESSPYIFHNNIDMYYSSVQLSGLILILYFLS